MDTRCLQEVLERLTSGTVQQRKNAIDVISELLRISSDSATVLSQLSWYDNGVFSFDILCFQLLCFL